MMSILIAGQGNIKEHWHAAVLKDRVDRRRKSSGGSHDLVARTDFPVSEMQGGVLAGSFTWMDIKAILLAIPCFIPYLFAPGYFASRVTNLFDFRKQSAGMQIALSLVVSLGIMPVCANLLARFVSMRVCSVVLLAFTIGSILIFISDRIAGGRAPIELHTDRGRSTGGLFVSLAIVWLLVCLFTFPDLQIGTRLWSSVLIYDQAIHAAFVDAVLRSGTPPHNPLCFFGQPIIARYYYYWSTMCALPAALAHIESRATLAASSFWCGLSLAALIPIYLKYFVRVSFRLGKMSVMGACLLCITGLDLIPTALTYLTHGFVYADMDWWSNTLVPSWVDSILWTPHHIAGLICCLSAFLLLWHGERGQDQPAPLLEGSENQAVSSGPISSLSPRRQAVRVVLAGFALASAGGLSVYITLCFLLFVIVWLARLVYKRQSRMAARFLASGCIALILSIPFLRDLRQPASHFVGAHSHANHLFTTGIRTSGWVKAVMPDHHFLRAPLLILDMGVTYCFELGFYLVVLILIGARLYARRGRMREWEKALCYLLIVAGIATTFIRSEAIRTNDFGIRSVLLVQWVLLLWSIPLVTALRFRPSLVLKSRLVIKRSLFITLILGLCASVYQVLLLRFAAPLDSLAATEHQPIQRMPALSDGHADWMIRSAYSSLDRQVAAGIVAQYNPFNADALQMLTYAHHQLVAATADDCGTAFGGTAEGCARAKDQLRRLYAIDGAKVSPDTLQDICRTSFINVLIVQQSDPVWHLDDSWVWQQEPLISNAGVRIIPCSKDIRP